MSFELVEVDAVLVSALRQVRFVVCGVRWRFGVRCAGSVRFVVCGMRYADDSVTGSGSACGAWVR